MDLYGIIHNHVPSDGATRDMRGEQGQSYPAKRDGDESVIRA